MTLDSEDDKPFWDIGETIKILNSFSFTRLNLPGDSGGCGQVFPAYEPINDMIMMVKKAGDRDIYSRSSIEIEAKTLLMLPPHPHVLESFIVHKIYGDFHIFTEYMKGGNLYDLIQRDKLSSIPRKWVELYQMIYQIILGMLFLHSQNPPIIHRDIKPQNILIQRSDPNIPDSTLILKIADFGLSKNLTALDATAQPAERNIVSKEKIPSLVAQNIILHQNKTK